MPDRLEAEPGLEAVRRASHVHRMSYDTPPGRPPVLDMTPEGAFRTPPRMPAATRIGAVAALIALGAGAIAIAALLLWAAVLLIPVAIAAGAVAYLAFRFQLWRARPRATAPRVWPRSR